MCEYCEPNKHGLCEPFAYNVVKGFKTPLLQIAIHENTNKLALYSYYDGEEPICVAIKVCPMCGRKL